MCDLIVSVNPGWLLLVFDVAVSKLLIHEMHRQPSRD